MSDEEILIDTAITDAEVIADLKALLSGAESELADARAEVERLRAALVAAEEKLLEIAGPHRWPIPMSEEEIEGGYEQRYMEQVPDHQESNPTDDCLRCQVEEWCCAALAQVREALSGA